MKYDINQISGVIKDRRTIYPEVYSDKIVEKEIIQEIISNAIWAPSHGKTQPWRFKVYTGEGRLKLLENVRKLYTALTPPEEFNQQKLSRMEARIEKTSALILLVMNRTENTKIPKIEEIEAVACAGQNMLLTAAAYGIGGFWSSPQYLYTPQANAAFGLKEDDFIQGLFYFGYPSGEWPNSICKPLEDVIDWID